MAITSRTSRRPDARRFTDLLVNHAQFRQNSKLAEIEAIMREHDAGNFARSALLCEEAMTDDRINSVVSTRIGALLSAPRKMKSVDEEDEVAQKLAAGFEKAWPAICGSPILAQLKFWGLFMGVAVAELVWEGTPKYWIPRLVVYHPANLRWWDWERRFYLNTRDGQVPLPRPDEQPNGDGKWFVYCPFGVQYGWRRGLIRPTALKYLSRGWNDRDWDRYNEMRAMGLIKALVPPQSPSSDATEQEDAFFDDLSNMGSEPVIQCPQGPNGKDGPPGYDVQIAEFTSRNWEGLKERKQDLNTDISILWLGQNLTVEAGTAGASGNRAMGQIHNLVRIDKALEDAEIGPELGRQVIVPTVIFNGGDPAKAPIPTYDVAPPEDEKGEAETLKLIAETLTLLMAVDPQIDIKTILETYGLPRLSDEEWDAMLGEEGEGASAGAGDGASSGVQITPSAQSAIIKVDEARALIGLGPLLTESGAPDPDGALTVAEFQAKHADVVARAVNAEDGSTDGTKPEQSTPGAPGDSAGSQSFAVGDRVKVTATPHPGMEKMSQVGTVQIISPDAAYGILFDGMDSVHKWYVGSELQPAAADSGRAPRPTQMRATLTAGSVVRRARFAGLPVAIENPRGSIRLWTDEAGRKGATKMELDYGFIEGSFSGDREPLDCYLGPDESAQHVFVIHQRRAPDYRGWDEDKVMLGFRSADAAMAGFCMHRDDADRAFHSMTMFTLDAFKAKLRARRAASTGKIRARAQTIERALGAMAGRGGHMVSLAKSIAARTRAGKYQDALIKASTKRAAEAMAPYLRALGGDVASAGSLGEIRRALLRRFKDGSSSSRKLAKLIADSAVMGKMHGLDDGHQAIED